MNKTHRFSVAIIGLGSQGRKTWFESLKNATDIDIAAVCDNNQLAVDEFASRYPETPAFSSLDELLLNIQPTFAIACVPNRFHLQVIEQLSASGIPCLKEKPIAGSLAEYHKLCRIPIPIGVAFQRRWQPRYVHFRNFLPIIGTALSVRATLVGKYNPPQDGWRVTDNVGTFDDLGVHMLDAIIWLFGRPTTVLAHRINDPFSDRDRESHVVMRWGDPGLVAHLYISEVALGKEESVIVRGDRGSLHLNGNEIVHYDTSGRQAFQMAIQSRKEDTIQDMCREFAGHAHGTAHSFSTVISQVEDTLMTTEAIDTSFLSNKVESVASQSEDLTEADLPTPSLTPSPKSLPIQKANSDIILSDSDYQETLDTRHTHEECGDADADFTKLSFQLNTGDKIPGLGFGTRKPKQPMQTYNAVKTALELGYRHVDTAFRYNNEDQVGSAVIDSGIPREEVWITTKVDNSWHHRVAESVTISLSNLGLEYIDLLLMHWPSPVTPEDPKKALPDWDFTRTWVDMQAEVRAGRVRNIGVSNFGIRNLKKLLQHPECTIVPAVNQLELHPCCPSNVLIAYCKDNGIHCTAYSPLAAGLPELVESAALKELCQRKGKTPQQILIMWGLQRGTSVIPKSVNTARIQGNFDLKGWTLTLEEHQLLSDLETRCRVYPDDWLPQQVFWEEDN